MTWATAAYLVVVTAGGAYMWGHDASGYIFLVVLIAILNGGRKGTR
jgi:hypothetical protein